jgi:glutamate racemase
MNIGVFDSGVGGKSFVLSVQTRFPDANIIYKEDRENLPYGNKTPEQLFSLTLPIFKQFETESCAAVLVACNSVTTNIIHLLRSEISIPLVGVEPMIKPAAQVTETGVIAVCATPATLQSKRYAELKKLYAQDVTVVEPDCSNWAQMIEDNRSDELELTKMVMSVIQKGADVLLLGCTHYHWIEDRLRDISGRSLTIMQPTEQVINQLEKVIKEQEQSL